VEKVVRKRMGRRPGREYGVECEVLFGLIRDKLQ